MTNLMQIHLKNLKFYCYHGLVEGEEVLGGEYEVNVTASYVPEALSITTLEETLDYTSVYEIVKARMQKPTPLLETIATETASEIIERFSNVIEVAVSIFKLHPPVKNFEGSVGVTFTMKRN